MVHFFGHFVVGISLLRISILLDRKATRFERNFWFIIFWQRIFIVVFDRILSILKIILTSDIYVHHLVFLHTIKLIMILIIIISIILRFTVSDIPTVAITVLKFTIYCLPFKIIFLDQSFIFIIIRVVLVFITEVLIFWHSEGLWASSLMLNMVFVFKIFF